MAKSEEQPPSGADTKKRKNFTYVVSQRGDATWHWEVRENRKLIDSGDANSVVDARAAALVVGTKRN